jgi:hypothetical protein
VEFRSQHWQLFSFVTGIAYCVCVCVCVCDFYYVSLFNLCNVTKVLGERMGLVLFRNILHLKHICEIWEFYSGVVRTLHLKRTVSSICPMLIWSMIHGFREAVCSVNLSDCVHLIFCIATVHSSLVLISSEVTIHSFLIGRGFRSKKFETDGRTLCEPIRRVAS